VNDTANAKMTIGITVNQGANDNEVFAGKSSDVAHGATDIAETDTAFFFAKRAGVTGGLGAVGICEGNIGTAIYGYAGAQDNTRSTSGRSDVEIVGKKFSGTSVTNSDANANIFGVRTQRGGSEVTLFIVDEDGDFQYDGSDAGAYDAYEDALACSDLNKALSSRYHEFVKYNRDALVKMGVISAAGFVSGKRMNMLQLGAISELYRVVKALCVRAGLSYNDLGILPA